MFIQFSGLDQPGNKTLHPFSLCLQLHNTLAVLLLFYFRRSESEVSIGSNVANSNDLDRTSRADSVLDAIGKKMERIDASVGDPTQYYIG